MPKNDLAFGEEHLKDLLPENFFQVFLIRTIALL